mmetsp:Transcript_27451/g.87009  ORF Transcript_27451/g.87009 Transcript_27451/m.87009 type:complete len:410 (-) Transcript_27451:40-1269(-)
MTSASSSDEDTFAGIDLPPVAWYFLIAAIVVLVVISVCWLKLYNRRRAPLWVRENAAGLQLPKKSVGMAPPRRKESTLRLEERRLSRLQTEPEEQTRLLDPTEKKVMRFLKVLQRDLEYLRAVNDLLRTPLYSMVLERRHNDAAFFRWDRLMQEQATLVEELEAALRRHDGSSVARTVAPVIKRFTSTLPLYRNYQTALAEASRSLGVIRREEHTARFIDKRMKFQRLALLEKVENCLMLPLAYLVELRDVLQVVKEGAPEDVAATLGDLHRTYTKVCGTLPTEISLRAFMLLKGTRTPPSSPTVRFGGRSPRPPPPSEAPPADAPSPVGRRRSRRLGSPKPPPPSAAPPPDLPPDSPVSSPSGRRRGESKAASPPSRMNVFNSEVVTRMRGGSNSPRRKNTPDFGSGV